MIDRQNIYIWYICSLRAAFYTFFVAIVCAYGFMYDRALADELRPAYIAVDEQGGGYWSTLFKASERSRLGVMGHVIMPDFCHESKEKLTQRRDGGNLYRRQFWRCDQPLFGAKIGLAGLNLASTDALLRVELKNAPVIILRLTPDATEAKIIQPMASGADDGHGLIFSNVALTYGWIGIEHILFGFDHLFFVISLVLLLAAVQQMTRSNIVNIVKTITAFTLSHSITLIGTILGFFSLPQRPVEAVIALSIVFLCVEVVKANPEDPRLSARYPWLVAFLFGLLHGFGFAGALAEIGLPNGDVPLALLTFNIGVELGQLWIVFLFLIALHILWRRWISAIPYFRLITAYVMGSIATYWLIERLL